MDRKRYKLIPWNRNEDVSGKEVKVCGLDNAFRMAKEILDDGNDRYHDYGTGWVMVDFYTDDFDGMFNARYVGSFTRSRFGDHTADTDLIKFAEGFANGNV